MCCNDIISFTSWSNHSFNLSTLLHPWIERKSNWIERTFINPHDNKACFLSFINEFFKNLASIFKRVLEASLRTLRYLSQSKIYLILKAGINFSLVYFKLISLWKVNFICIFYHVPYNCSFSFVAIHELFYSFLDEVIPLQFYSSFWLSIPICYVCCLKYLFTHNWRLTVDILNHLEINSQLLFSSSYSPLIISKLSINLLKQLSFPFNISFFQFYFNFVC